MATFSVADSPFIMALVSKQGHQKIPASRAFHPSHDFAIKFACHHNMLQPDTRKDVLRMISTAAIRQAESLCRQQQQIFARIERKCITYVRMSESVLGPYKNQADPDKLFLMLVRAELDHPAEEDSAQHGHAAWNFA
jgi:hypothetical protein